ncbi:MAG: 30S ribosomal protein S6 [Planctomycetota bacterium]
MSERLYEGMFLFDANESSKRWSDLESHVGSLLQKHSAKLEYTERWPDQRLAYEVGGARKGTYYLTYFSAPPERVKDIRRDAELSEDILRLLIISEPGLEQEMKDRRESSERRGGEIPVRELRFGEGESDDDGGDRYGDRHGSRDRYGGDRSGGDRYGGDRSGGDRYGGDRSGDRYAAPRHAEPEAAADEGLDDRDRS